MCPLRYLLLLLLESLCRQCFAAARGFSVACIFASAFIQIIDGIPTAASSFLSWQQFFQDINVTADKQMRRLAD
jgi:hypothetical protein